MAVAGEARDTRFGRLMNFDDSYEHNAWKDSEAARIVLIFEIWHPGAECCGTHRCLRHAVPL